MESSTVMCPKCGHWNDAASINCAKCRINLAWALENWRAYQEVERCQMQSPPNPSKPEISEIGLDTVPSPLKLLMVPIILLSPLLLSFLFLVPYLDETSIRPCSAAIGVVMLGIMIGWAFLYFAARPNPYVVAAWRDLAQRTGLTLIFKKNDLALQGEYRGHFISMTMLAEQVSDTSVEVYTRTSIQVDDGGNLFLDVAGKSFREPKIKGEVFTIGDAEFNQRYSIRGFPPMFVNQAYKLIIPHKRLMLDRPEAAAMRTPFISWTNLIRPAIKLEKSELVCLQLSVLVRAEEQKIFLDLLCDIADLAEDMGSKGNRQ